VKAFLPLTPSFVDETEIEPGVVVLGIEFDCLAVLGLGRRNLSLIVQRQPAAVRGPGTCLVQHSLRVCRQDDRSGLLAELTAFSQRPTD
jgi:hypothetical protein